MMQTKTELRAAVRARKKAFPAEEAARRSAMLCHDVRSTQTYRQARSVYGYLPFNREVDLQPLLQQALDEGKQVALPKCFGKEMRFILISDLSQIRASAFGAPEPIADGPEARDPDALVLVPGLVFDRQGFRIGYGGGYYDRFLSAEPGHPTVSVCFDFQLVPRLDPEPHDIPVHTVFSR